MALRLTIVALALLLAPHVRADLLRVEARDVSEDVGAPEGLRSWKLVAVFDGPDGVHTVVGDAERPIVFDTNAPDGIVNDGGILSGYMHEDLPWYVGTEVPEWDTYLAVTLAACQCESGFADPALSCGWGYSPYFLDSDGTHAVLVDGMTSFVEDDGRWHRELVAECDEILLAQFTVAEGYGVRLSGTMRRFEEGEQVLIPFCVSSADFTRCEGDLDGDGAVGLTDLLVVLNAWGPCAPPCSADLNGNGAVDFVDLLTLLGDWGPCPFPSGACCLPDGTCFDSGCTQGLECENHGGTFLGVGTSCAAAECPEG